MVVSLSRGDPTLPMIRDDHRKLLTRYGAIGGALARGLFLTLHHSEDVTSTNFDTSTLALA
jgi:hypothetical protein